MKLRAGTRARPQSCRVRSMCGAMSAAWNPGDLTGLAATLLPAESLARGLLWQNTAKTVPAVADGDPVRVAVCPYTAVEFTAPSDATRPLLWDDGGGLWSLHFDGVDDLLTATYALSQPFTVAGAVILQTVSNGLKAVGGAVGDVRLLTGGTNWRFYAGSNFVLANPAVNAGVWNRFKLEFNGASSTIQMNADAATTGNVGTNNAGGLQVGGGPYINGNVSALISTGGLLDAGDAALVSAYIAALTP